MYSSSNKKFFEVCIFIGSLINYSILDILIKNELPLYFLFSIMHSESLCLIVPFSDFSITILEMYKPNPVPISLVVKYGSNILSFNSESIPPA